MNDLNKKVCPLLSDLSAIPQVVIHCTANCGWYVDEREGESSVYQGRCSMVYAKVLCTQMQNLEGILDNLQDISVGLSAMNEIIFAK